jgi:leucyl-tRNA synthetase
VSGQEYITEGLTGNLLEAKKHIHKTIANVTDDLDNFRFNKAIARIRELTNIIADLKSEDSISISIIKEGMETIILLLAPMVPHLSEELWSRMGNKQMVVNSSWPVANSKFVADDMITVAVQLNGKLKATIQLAKDSSEEATKKVALDDYKVKQALIGKEIRKIIVVPNRIVNVVVQ